MSEILDIAENWVYEVWQRGNVDFAKNLCAENYADFTVPDSPQGDCATFCDAVLEVRAAFPDLKAEVLDSFQDEDFVILRISFTGTHVSDFQEFAPTQDAVEWESIDILHFREQALIERFAQNDLLEQLEAIGTDFGAMQAESEHADLIGRLAEVPRQMREAIRANRVHKAQGDDMSTQATVGHLWRVERKVWQAAVQQMQTEENPYWTEWAFDDVNAEHDFAESDLNVLLDAYEFLRGETCRYLRELSGTDWDKRGTHSEDGEMDVAGLMEKAYAHDREHLIVLSGAQL